MVVVFWSPGLYFATPMCRKHQDPLQSFAPPATELEIRDASLQFVRKLSGFAVPSKANEAAFNAAVEEIAGRHAAADG